MAAQTRLNMTARKGCVLGSLVTRSTDLGWWNFQNLNLERYKRHSRNPKGHTGDLCNFNANPL